MFADKDFVNVNYGRMMAFIYSRAIDDLIEQSAAEWKYERSAIPFFNFVARNPSGVWLVDKMLGTLRPEVIVRLTEDSRFRGKFWLLYAKYKTSYNLRLPDNFNAVLLLYRCSEQKDLFQWSFEDFFPHLV